MELYKSCRACRSRGDMLLQSYADDGLQVGRTVGSVFDGLRVGSAEFGTVDGL